MTTNTTDAIAPSARLAEQLKVIRAYRKMVFKQHGTANKAARDDRRRAIAQLFADTLHQIAEGNEPIARWLARAATGADE